MMDSAAWEAFSLTAIRASTHGLSALHLKYGLDRVTRWTCDPKETPPAMRLWDATDDLLFEREVLEVGTFVPHEQTWKWGWCNPSVPENVRAQILPLQDLAEITGMALFASDQPFACDEAMAIRLAAVATAHLGSPGYYPARIDNVRGEAIVAYFVYRGSI